MTTFASFALGVAILGYETVGGTGDRVALLLIAYALVTGAPVVNFLERFRK